MGRPRRLWRAAATALGLGGIAPWAVPLRAHVSPAPFHAGYVVAVKDTAAHLLHVTATFSGVHQPTLDLALPVWTPGWYTIENYARNMERFTVTDGAGRPLSAHLVHMQTWRVDTRGADRVVADFDYLANVMALNQAKLTGNFAFFTGTQLFLQPLGHRDAPDTVRLLVPSGWRIVSALRATSDSGVFTAGSYDELVDGPTIAGAAGAFRVIPFMVQGKPVRFVLAFPGAPAADSLRGYLERSAAIISAESAIFGGLPYDNYVVFDLMGLPADSMRAQGGLEHANSYVECCGPSVGTFDWKKWMAPVHISAHEFFHLWNVKRIRPAGMWPYDYSHPNETPSLWFSEGVTNYYDDLIQYRAGITQDTTFLGSLSYMMDYDETGEAHRYISPSDASVSTWLGYDNPPAFFISYYNMGEVLGALLDLSIRHDTRGARGLDDVMRALYRDYYQRDRGFTPTDLVRTVSALAGRDYAGFFRRYVTGTWTPPYDTIFGYAGFDVTRRQSSVGRAWFCAVPAPGGLAVTAVRPGYAAALAGLERGDTLIAADGTPIGQVAHRQVAVCGGWRDWGGRRVVFTAVRNGRQRDVPVVFDPPITRVSYVIRPDSAASPAELAVRSAWLARAP